MSTTDARIRSGRHRKFRTAVLTYAALVIGLLLALRAGHLRLPMYFVFPAFLSLLACPTLFWWSWVDERIAFRPRPLAAEPAPSQRQSRLLAGRLLLVAYAAAMLAPLIMLSTGWRAYRQLPVPVLMWLMGWHLSITLAGLAGLVIWLPVVIAKRIRTLPLIFGDFQKADNDVAEPHHTSIQMSRRALLTGALTGAPMLVAGSTVASGLQQQGKFMIRRLEMRLPRLPDRLRGLTITHLSDFHVGRLFRPEHLHRVVDATAKLNSDIVAITGDTVDHSADYLPQACDAFAGMTGRYGRFVVIGNHDLIDSPRQAVDYLAAREPNFLVDRCYPLEIGGERLQIAGLFWSRYDRQKFGLPGHRDRVEATMGSSDPDLFTIALAHHPDAFDALADANVDLTLAGHTHGGQLMVTPPGSDTPIGGGNLLFRYIWGEYRRNHSALYVNSGVGNWFPIRINAPAEIVQIRLI